LKAANSKLLSIGYKQIFNTVKIKQKQIWLRPKTGLNRYFKGNKSDNEGCK